MKWCLNRIAGFFKKLGLELTIGLITGVIAATAFFILPFAVIDTTPATQADYEELESQLAAIQQDPDLLLKTHGKIFVKDDGITVTVMNEECEVSADFNQDYEILSTTRTDYAYNFFVIFIPMIVVTPLFFVLFALGVAGIAERVTDFVWKKKNGF